ncbi:phage tail protein [Hydrogenophaga sp.]|uniref:phage tail protein n=1 Tax=Hydrogenophaga sp. TaxID=1904254 RepID=UPI003D0CF2B8
MPFDAQFSASASASASVGAGVSAQASLGLGERGGHSPGAQPQGRDVAENLLPPLVPFRFHVRFRQSSDGAQQGDEVVICSGAFAECSGLEATMEPKQIRAGGMNYGAAQRAGPVSFATVVLKRGMTRTRHLWKWFEMVSGGAYATRVDVEIDVHNAAGETVLTWGLAQCLPVKFKAADLNAKGTEVAVEELHLVHEGLSLIQPGS